MNELEQLAASPLGKSTVYSDQYDPKLLFPICRDVNRIKIGIDINTLPFQGVDIWNGFDLTWLDQQGMPQYGMLTIFVPCASPNLIESKSLKLYLFSFANTKFHSKNTLLAIISNDITAATGAAVTVIIEARPEYFVQILPHFTGDNIDNLEVACTVFGVTPSLLRVDQGTVVTEQLCSDLLKSNCLVTTHPDWGSVRISYTGPKIDREALLKYIVSYRKHQGFHEQCIEHIFFDVLNHCQPTQLTVEGRYTRRGSLDINPIRSNAPQDYSNYRLFRQ